MKKLLLASVFITVIASNAFASGLYISPKIGYSFVRLSDKFRNNIYEYSLGTGKDTTVHLGAAVGYDFSKNGVNLRVEGEYLNLFKTQTDVRFIRNYSETISVNFFNANAYYDFKNSTPFTPYIGGGIGLALVDFEYAGVHNSGYQTKFAWNLQAGLDYRFDDHNAIGIGYRFSDIVDNIEVKQETAALMSEHSAHEVTLSYRYTF